MKNATSPARRLLLSKNFILMLVMLVLIIVAISAWFSFHKTVDANNIAVKAVSTEIDIAPCIKLYNDPSKPYYDETKDRFSILSDGPGEFTHEINIPAVSLSKDCTGDGLNLIVPEFNVTKDYDSVRTHYGKEVNVNVGAADAISNKQAELSQLQNPDAEPPEYQYIEYEFYARSKNKDLILQNDTQLLASVEASGGSLSTALGTGDPKRSAYGSFNVDGLVGAIRVALIGEACAEVNQNWVPITGGGGEINTTDATRLDPVKQILWVPRPDVKLNIPQDAGDISNWTLTTSGLTGGVTYSNSYYKKINGNIAVQLVDPDPNLGGTTKVSSGHDSSGIPNLGENINISDFSSYGSSNQPQPLELVVDHNDIQVTSEYYVTKYTLKIWIEGTDTEARRAMDGGQFKLTLNLL